MKEEGKKEREPGQLLTLKLKIGVAALLVVTIIGASAAYVWLPQWRSGIVFVASAFAVAGALYSAFYAGESLRTQSRRQKLDATMKVMDAFHSLESVRLRTKLEREFDHKKIAPAAFYDTVTGDPEFHAAAKYLLNVCERMAISVQHGYIDERVAFDECRTIVPWTFETFRPYVEKMREKYNDKTLYEGVQALANAWSSGNLLSEGNE